MLFPKTVQLDDVWQLIDLPYERGFLTDDYRYAAAHVLDPEKDYSKELPALFAELNDSIGVSFYCHLVDGELYGYIVVKNSRPLQIKRSWVAKQKFLTQIEKHVDCCHKELVSLGERHPHLFHSPLVGKQIATLSGYLFHSHLESIASFAIDKEISIQLNGECEVRSKGKERYFGNFKFYLVSILDAPYSAEFWKKTWDYHQDFYCVTSIDRIDQKFAKEAVTRVRNIYHATSKTSEIPDLENSFHYSTIFVYPSEHYEELQEFLKHLRRLGCNVAVASILAEECLANILPPGNPYGTSITENPAALFPFPNSCISHRHMDGKPTLKPASPTIQLKRSSRSEVLAEKWPLIRYDPGSGTFISDRHDFTKLYVMDRFWDPAISPVVYPAVDRALNVMATDNRLSLTFYLQRAPLDPSDATNPLLHQQISYLKENNLCFKTKAFLALSYAFPERHFNSIRSMTNEDAWQEIANRISEANKQIKNCEEALHMFTENPLSGDSVLDFFNPLLQSSVGSMDHFLQDPFSNHYVSEYLVDTDLIVGSNWIYFNGKYWGVIMITDYPNNVHSNFWKVLLSSYPKQFLACVKLRALTAQQQETLLKRRQRIFNASTTTGFSAVKNVESEYQLEEMEKAQREQYAKGERVFDSQIVLMQCANTRSDLDQEQGELLSKLRLLGFSPLRPRLATGPIFFSCLPPAKIYSSFNRRTTTQVATHLLPVHLTLAEQDLANADVCFVDRTGTPDGHSLFHTDRKNQNCVITGSTGEGKTMLGEFLLECHMARYPDQTKTTILDLGVLRGQGSYKRWVQEAAGQYLAFSYNTSVGFDIMTRLRKDPLNKEELNFVAYMIEQMTADPTLQAEGKSGIRLPRSEAFDYLSNFTENVLSEDDITLKNFVSRYTLRSEFAQCLGRWQPFFFNPESVDFANPLICYDFQSLAKDDPHLVSLLAYFIMQNAWLDITNTRYKYKVIVADELNLLLKNRMIADWVNQVVKTGRKAGVAVILLSQDLTDMSRSEGASALLANSAEGFLMRQDYSELMRSSFYITPEDWSEMAIASQPRVYSEFVRSGNNVDRLYVPPSYFGRRHTNYLDLYESKLKEESKELEGVVR